jgi:predicted nucleotidyltransferase
MISEKDKETIQIKARKYHASRVILFGSSLSSCDGRDIDIGVDGIAAKDFFTFHGELLLSLTKPVDLVDLSKKSKFTDMVLKEGAPLNV